VINTKESEQAKILKEFILHGFNIVNKTSKYGHTVLGNVLMHLGHTQLVQTLVESGASVTAESFVCFAADSVYHRVPEDMRERLIIQNVAYLLQAGADINATYYDDGESRTAIHFALKRGRIALYKFLMSKGCTVGNNENVSGTLQAFIADTEDDQVEDDDEIAQGYENKEFEKTLKRLIIILKKYKLNLNKGDGEGVTPLMKHVSKYPVGKGYVIVKTLLENGADVTKIDHHGRSVLMHALMAKNENEDAGPRKRKINFLCNLRIIKMIVNRGGYDPDHKDNDGRTALDYAIFHRCDDIQEFLKKCGGGGGAAFTAEDVAKGIQNGCVISARV